MKKNNKKPEKEKKLSIQNVQNYNKSGQPGTGGNVNMSDDHKNWGLLRCVAPTNIY